MKRNVITLGTGYSATKFVFEDETLVDLIFNALKQARRIELEFLDLKSFKVAGDSPQFSQEYFDVLQPEEFEDIRTAFEAMKAEEANRQAREAEIAAAYAEQELQLAA